MKTEEKKEEDNELDFDYDEYYRDFPPLVPIFIIAIAVCVVVYFLLT